MHNDYLMIVDTCSACIVRKLVWLAAILVSEKGMLSFKIATALGPLSLFSLSLAVATLLLSHMTGSCLYLCCPGTAVWIAFYADEVYKMVGIKSKHR